jgi:hypothetical protein
MSFAWGIFDDAHLLDCDESAPGNHLVENGKQAFDMSLVVYNFDEHGQICRQLDEIRRVNHTAGPEACRALEDRRAGKTLSTKAFEQRPRKRSVMESIRLSQKDPNQKLLAV